MYARVCSFFGCTTVYFTLAMGYSHMAKPSHVLSHQKLHFESIGHQKIRKLLWPAIYSSYEIPVPPPVRPPQALTAFCWPLLHSVILLLLFSRTHALFPLTNYITPLPPPPSPILYIGRKRIRIDHRVHPSEAHREGPRHPVSADQGLRPAPEGSRRAPHVLRPLTIRHVVWDQNAERSA